MSTDYKTGEELLAAFNCITREQKLEQAVKALMEQLETTHIAAHRQSLANNLADMFCSCADAYRMGHAALQDPERDRVAQIDEEFEKAEGWGSWMIAAANEREAICNRRGWPHKHQARSSSGGRVD